MSQFEEHEDICPALVKTRRENVAYLDEQWQKNVVEPGNMVAKYTPIKNYHIRTMHDGFAHSVSEDELRAEALVPGHQIQHPQNQQNKKFYNNRKIIPILISIYLAAVFNK